MWKGSANTVLILIIVGLVGFIAYQNPGLVEGVADLDTGSSEACSESAAIIAEEMDQGESAECLCTGAATGSQFQSYLPDNAENPTAAFHRINGSTDVIGVAVLMYQEPNSTEWKLAEGDTYTQQNLNAGQAEEAVSNVEGCSADDIAPDS